MQNRNYNDKILIPEIRKIHHQMPRWIILLIFLIAVIFLAVNVASLLVILLISGISAYILSEIINKFEAFGLKRNLIVIALYILLAGTLVVLNIALFPYLQHEIRSLSAHLPEISKQAEAALKQSSFEFLKDLPIAEETIKKAINEVFSPSLLISRAFNLSGMFGHAASVLLGIVLVPFFVFFLLKDWPSILRTVMDWIPPAYVETTVSAFSEINILVGKYLRGITIDCIAMAILASFGLWLIGINYPVSLGIMTGAANIIPYLGPIIACFAASVIALIQFNSIGAVLNVILLYVVIKLIDDLILQPLTVGKSVRLHPMLLVISIIVGEKLFGVIGMMIAVPVVTIAQKVLGIFIDNHRHTASRQTQDMANKIIV